MQSTATSVLREKSSRACANLKRWLRTRKRRRHGRIRITITIRITIKSKTANDMAKKVRIPTPLRKLTNNEEIVEIKAVTIGEAIVELQSRYPGIKERLV